MKAHLIIEKPETFMMLQRDAQILERSLQGIGMDTGDGGISFELAQDNMFQNEGDRGGERYQTGKGATAIETITRRDRNKHVTIFENANRLSRIVDNLLNMTRIDSGVFKVSKQSHVLEEVVGSTLRGLTEGLHGRRVEVHIPAELPLVPMDEVLFQQVLINLLDNALKYSPAVSPIELSAELDGERLRVEVADRGSGIASGEESRVFDKFFRGTVHRNDQVGSGLGLTICRAIIAAHGGSIVAENRPEGGARFRLWLPLHSTAASELSPPRILPQEQLSGASTETDL